MGFLICLAGIVILVLWGSTSWRWFAFSLALVGIVGPAVAVVQMPLS